MTIYLNQYKIGYKHMKTHVYIDASNLFYGGKKSLGWSVDYKKLYQYLIEKYHVSNVFFFGGVEIHKFPFDYLQNDTVPIHELETYLVNLVKTKGDFLSDAELKLLDRHLKRVRFYIKIEKYGKEVLVLARASRTAREMKRFAGDKFLDFEYLRERLKRTDPGEDL